MKVPFPNGYLFNAKTNKWESKVTDAVDMKQAVAGSTVHFRCGGSAVVTGIEQVIDRLSHMVQFDKSSQGVRYYDNGQYSPIDTPFDIIRIEPPQFKWEDVKRGMAFIPLGKNYHGYFIGYDMDGFAVLDLCHIPHDKRDEDLLAVKIGYLTRSPEHDKVQP